jgi:hypothetical protein
MLTRTSWPLAVAATFLLLAWESSAALLHEDFSNDPAASGWRIWGDTNLFTWNAAQGALNVTWDSSRSNSFFYKRLGTVLARDDDFSFQLDLRLQDIATTTKSGPFEIAVGLINLADATRTGYWRGSGVNAEHGPRNVFELDYFPAGYYPGFGDVAPSISPTVVSMDNGFASGFSLTELTNGQLYHLEMAYSASNGVIHTTISAEGGFSLTLDDVVLGSAFTDFRIDSLALCSYSDTGDDFDSVLAHGTVDNLLVTLPPPPVQQFTGSLSNGIWVAQFLTRTNWVYTVERASDLQTWIPASAPLDGTGTILTFQDPNPPSPAAFYRVTAQRP